MTANACRYQAQEEDVYEWVVIKSQGVLSSACACVCVCCI